MFSHWEDDCSPDTIYTPAFVDFTSGDVHCTAVFLECFSLTLNVSPDPSGTAFADDGPDCEADGYADGDQVPIEASNADNWVFDHWSGDGDCAGSTDNPPTDNPLLNHDLIRRHLHGKLQQRVLHAHH